MQSIRHQFVAWVGSQPADRAYDYFDNRNCAFAQFLRDVLKVENPSVTSDEWRAGAGDYRPIPDDLADVVHGGPDWICFAKRWTFGALAERLASQPA